MKEAYPVIQADRDGPPYASDTWKQDGYNSPEEEIDDMANVGRALMETIALNSKEGPLKGWHPADCPSEIVTDLLNMIDDAASTVSSVVEMREALEKISSGEAFREQRFAEDDDTDYFLRCQRKVQQLAGAILSRSEGERK